MQYYTACMGTIMQGGKPAGWSDAGVDCFSSLFRGMQVYPNQTYVGSPIKVDGLSTGSCCFFVQDEGHEHVDVHAAALSAEAAAKIGKLMEHISEPHRPRPLSIPWAPPLAAMPCAFQVPGAALGGNSLQLPHSTLTYTCVQ